MSNSESSHSNSLSSHVNFESRLPALDCLRGLVLVMVLADHIDGVAGGTGLIQEWTLIGMGLSDAADVFVFLSGFVFGWVYGRRIERDGRWVSIKHVFFRVLQIYAAFIACIFCAGVLRISSGDTNLDIQISDWSYSVVLVTQPRNTAILCLYLVLLPWLLLLFVTFEQRLWWCVLGISIGVYVVSLVLSARNCPFPADWRFQPLAWQLLMVLAATHGRTRNLTGRQLWPRSSLLFVASVLVLLLGLAVKKSEWIADSWPAALHSLESRGWTSKSNWAPLRALHHLSLVYAMVYLLPLRSVVWSSGFLEPLRVCGRHSLTIYCVGVVLTEIASILFRWMGNAPGVVWLLVLDAVFCQWLIAYLLDRRSVLAMRFYAAGTSNPV